VRCAKARAERKSCNPAARDCATCYAGVATRPGHVPAGTSFTLTLTPSSGSPVSYTLTSDTFTTEAISFTGLTSSALSAITFDQPMTFSWTLPSTFAVARVKLDAGVLTGHQNEPGTFNCSSEETILPNTATSGAITIPSTCNGFPVLQVDGSISAEGPNGEGSHAIFFFQ